MSQENLRAADADRNKVVEELREHTAAGRLTMDEFEERMQAAMTARTFGDLTKLTTDLPALAEPAPQDGPVDLAAFTPPRVRPNLRPLRIWASISVFFVGLWLLSVIASGGHTQGFWPIWPVGLGALFMLSRVIRHGGGYGRPSLADRHARHMEMREAQREVQMRRIEERMARRAELWEQRMGRRVQRWETRYRGR